MLLSCNFIVTNQRTFKLIINFILNGEKYYTNMNHKNHGDFRDYSISFNNKVYNIYYKSKIEFFKKLREYLVLNNGDSSALEKLKRF